MLLEKMSDGRDSMLLELRLPHNENGEMAAARMCKYQERFETAERGERVCVERGDGVAVEI